MNRDCFSARMNVRQENEGGERGQEELVYVRPKLGDGSFRLVSGGATVELQRVLSISSSAPRFDHLFLPPQTSSSPPARVRKELQL